MALPIFHTVKRAFYYNFYPSRAEEETGKPNRSITGSPYRRMLVEVRDVYTPPLYDPHNPWQITKTLSHVEVASGKILVSFNDTFQHVLRYWEFRTATHLTVYGNKVAVVVWDFTVDKIPRMHRGEDIYFQLTPNDNYALKCMAMVKERNLKAGDKIGLHWDKKDECFCIKFFY